MKKIIPKFKGIKAYEEKLEMSDQMSINGQKSVEKQVKTLNTELDPKLRIISNEKRLQTLKSKLDFDKRQQLLVKEAINSENRVNKRIVFETDFDLEDKSEESFSRKEPKSLPKPKTKQLFESDSEDEELDISDNNNLKEIELDFNKKINDKNAEKLIELNSRFAHDVRFRIDERFLDTKQDNEETEESIGEEQKNLNLLEEVLGKKFKPIIKTKDKSLESDSFGDNINKNNLFVSRFDPNSEKSSVYEVNSSLKKNTKKVSFNDKVLDNEVVKSVDKDQTPIVSNEIYYEVSSDLKESLAQKEEEFSLSKILGITDYSTETTDKSSEQQNNKPFYEELKTNKRKLDVMSNPFKYDSSSSDEEEGEEDIAVRTEPKAKPFLNSYKFFFDKNDLRFTEDLFYSKELVEKAKNSWKDRQRMIIRSMSVRKRSAKKNKKSDQKWRNKMKNYNSFKRFKSSQ